MSGVPEVAGRFEAEAEAEATRGAAGLVDELLRAVAAGDGELAIPPELGERTLARPLAAVLKRPGKRLRARLVGASWRIAGARRPLPPTLPFIVELIHAGSLVIDDIEDGSSHRRGVPALHRIVGLPLALNAGSAFYFLALEQLGGLGLPGDIEHGLYRDAARAMLRCHQGQALDLGLHLGEVSQDELPRVVHVMSALKTGSLCELALRMGAAAAGAGAAEVRALGGFGRAFGTALQMLDDLGNLQGGRDPHKRHEDLRLGRLTWPWAWLAAELDTGRFAALVNEGRAVAAGADPCPLAGELLALLGREARARVRASLERAFDVLRAALGREAPLEELSRELEILERSYG